MGLICHRHIDKLKGALIQRPKSWGAAIDHAPPCSDAHAKGIIQKLQVEYG